jgi:hypothetical protein
MHRSTRATILLLTLNLGLVACKPDGTGQSDCSPDCLTGCGVSDGCGGICTCSDGLACGAEGVCIAEEQCTSTCESTGYSCGELCGESCGSCADDAVCFDGQCLAATPESCTGPECYLRLEVVEQRAAPDGGTQVTLAVAYEPPENAPHARIADIRLRSNRQLTVISAAAGQAILDAGKDLYRSPATGEAYRQKADGTLQFLAVSLQNTERIASGQLLNVTVSFTGDSAVFRLAKRQQIFAPPEADHVVQGSDYDAPVVVLK